MRNRRLLVCPLICLSFLLPNCSSSSSASEPGGTPAKSYSTVFPLTENPISENGNWINGGPSPGTGLEWGNVQTQPGMAFGTVLSGAPPYNDSTAVLAGIWGKNQSAQGTVFVTGTDTNATEEVELRLNTTITANNITGYECTASILSGNPYMQIVRWNGPLNNFTMLNGEAAFAQNGDVLKCVNDAGTITFYKNGTAIVSWTDTTYPNGSPGIGFWNAGGTLADLPQYGFSSFSATNSI